jgi:hypothetical protein
VRNELVHSLFVLTCVIFAISLALRFMLFILRRSAAEKLEKGEEPFITLRTFGAKDKDEELDELVDSLSSLGLRCKLRLGPGTTSDRVETWLLEAHPDDAEKASVELRKLGLL